MHGKKIKIYVFPLTMRHIKITVLATEVRSHSTKHYTYIGYALALHFRVLHSIHETK